MPAQGFPTRPGRQSQTVESGPVDGEALAGSTEVEGAAVADAVGVEAVEAEGVGAVAPDWPQAAVPRTTVSARSGSSRRIGEWSPQRPLPVQRAAKPKRGPIEIPVVDDCVRGLPRISLGEVDPLARYIPRGVAVAHIVRRAE